MLLGAIVGDMVGSPYECPETTIKTKAFPLFSPTSRFTDDSVMTLAVARGVMDSWNNPDGVADAVIDAMHDLGAAYPGAGYGGRFKQWLVNKERTPYGSWGNGSAMRVSAVGWAYDTLDTTEQCAARSAAVTHNHPEGVKGACAVAAAIYLARNNVGKPAIGEYITARYGYDLSRSVDDIRVGYRWEVSCQKSVPEALCAFLQSTGYEDAVRNAVSLGGDSDTIGAICGSVAAAFYGGVPNPLRHQALQRLDPPLRALLDKWNIWYDTRQPRSLTR